MFLSGYICQLSLIMISAYMILNGKAGITLGVMLAFLSYSRIFSGLLSSLMKIFSFLQPALASARRVFELLELEEITENSSSDSKLKKVNGDVSFEKVNFGYLPDKIVLHDFSAEVRAGQKVAIVGATGAGKSTVVNLLMRFYELNGGKIRLDGVPVNELSRERLHGFIGIVPQEIWMFEGSMRC